VALAEWQSGLDSPNLYRGKHDLAALSLTTAASLEWPITARSLMQRNGTAYLDLEGFRISSRLYLFQLDEEHVSKSAFYFMIG
jgi:hypothetical protein